MATVVSARSTAWPAAPRDEDGRFFARRRDAVVLGLVSVAILVLPLRELIEAWPKVVALAGYDMDMYLDGAARWLGGASFYEPGQLLGPYGEGGQVILYPPTALLLLAPLAALPRGVAGALWFTLPLLILAWQWIRFRPRPLVWPFLAIVIAWPPTLLTIAAWNSAPIFVAFLALATVWRWPAALILLKPSVLPLALWAANRRLWWIAAGLLALASVPFGTMWLDYLTVIENSRVGGVWHSVQQWPIFLWPILVWLGRTRGTPTRAV
jgi:hypothetical protein